MVSERAGTVLNILVREYIHTAAPVASEDIARLSPTKVSPATVRNTMYQLTEEGYISRPHASAGGVPSDRGYRYYVESLRKVPQLPVRIRQRIRRSFRGRIKRDVEAWSQECATILARLTANLAIVTVPRARSPQLKHIQLVYLQEFLALLIIVLQEARLLRRLLPLEESVTQDLLTQTANRLNERFSGLNHAEMEARQVELTPLEERVKRDAVETLREAETQASLQHYADGLRLLLSQPEFSQGNRAQEVVGMLEERVLLGSILSEVPKAGEIAVYIGGENRQENLRPFGIILGQYGTPRQASGTICVVGPTRMGYAEAMSGVRYLSAFMSQLVVDLHGGGAAG